MKTILISAMYASILPIGIPLAFVAIFISYWVDKTILLRRHQRPNWMSSELSDVMGQIMPWAIFIYAAFMYMFFNLLDIQVLLCFIILLIMLAYLITPVDTSVKYLCKSESATDYAEMFMDKPFEDAQLDFLEDYDRENPITQIEAWKAYIEMLKAKDRGS
jgi:hypothetical protein